MIRQLRTFGRSVRFGIDRAKDLGLLSGGALLLWGIMGPIFGIFFALKGLAWGIGKVKAIVAWILNAIWETFKQIVAMAYILLVILLLSFATTAILSVFVLFGAAGYYLTINANVFGLGFTAGSIFLYGFLLNEARYVIDIGEFYRWLLNGFRYS